MKAAKIASARHQLHANKDDIMNSKFIHIGLLALMLESTALSAMAQGQTFLSNLGEPPSGFVAVGSDSLIAVPFLTGDNTRGYFLQSIQLLMSAPTGSPNNFSISIHRSSRFEGPGTLIEYLAEPTPSTSGIFTYTPAANVALSPLSIYWLQVSGDTPVTTDSFSFSVTSSSRFESDQGWTPSTGYDFSTDGINWNVEANRQLQFAINATIVPEPSALALVGIGGLLLAGSRVWRRKTV